MSAAPRRWGARADGVWSDDSAYDHPAVQTAQPRRRGVMRRPQAGDGRRLSSASAQHWQTVGLKGRRAAHTPYRAAD